ncbi:tyrosine-type recombinase/integrase [Amycolatopsis sp. NPDC048633]|uniref:tyrosine-type recombinase/integrase n=1 Tax=Amycolatopsis sp. NPDC048633 TaxID=3157095 RepID=UPI0034067E59
MQHDVLSNDYVDPNAGELPFRAHTREWRKGQSTDASTRQTVTSHLGNGIFPFLGDKSLRAVGKTETIRDWLDWMERPKSEGGRRLAASYRAVLFDMVSAILEAARVDQKIRSNPCKAKSIKRPKPEQRKIVPWKASQIHRLKLALPASQQVVVPLGAGLGLRQMEIFGFSPEDVDREEMVANIQRQIRWIGNTPAFAPPKGGKTRLVPIGAGVLEEIDAHLDNFEPITVPLPWLEPAGRPETARLLIRRPQGLQCHGARAVSDAISGPDFNNLIWRPSYRTAELDYVMRREGMHGMRHFYASIALASGVSVKELAEYLGHRDPGYTLRIYTHVVPSSHRRAREAADGIFKPRHTGAARLEDPETA